MKRKQRDSIRLRKNRKTILEETTKYNHHGQTTMTICNLGGQLFGLLSQVRGSQRLPAEFPRRALCDVLAESGGFLHEAAVGKDVRPAQLRHLRACREADGDVCVLQARTQWPA